MRNISENDLESLFARGQWRLFFVRYSTKEYLEMLRLIGRKHSEIGPRFQCKIMDALYMTKDKTVTMPRKKEIIALISQLEDKSKEIINIIAKMDDKTRNVVAYGSMFANVDENSRRLSSIGSTYNSPVGPPYHERPLSGKSMADDLFERWIFTANDIRKTANATIDILGESERGRPPKPQVYKAVEHLRWVWETYSARKPTLSYDSRIHHRTGGPFFRFCEIALRPASDPSGSKLKIEGAVRAAVYGKKPPNDQ